MLLGNTPYPGDARVRAEATSLVEAGYHVTVVCPRKRPQPTRETVGGVDVRRFHPAPRPRSFAGYVLDTAWVTLACLVLAARVALAQRVDAVHVHNPPDTLILVAALFKAVGRPVVFDHHDLAPELYAANSPGGGRVVVRRALEALELLSCRLADRIVTTNASHRSLEVERCGVDPARIAIVRNGPDPDRLRPVESAERENGRPFTVGWLGVMSHHDGLDHLLLAVQHLVYDIGIRDVRCVLLGDGAVLEDCRTLASRLGLDGRVEFPGFVAYAELPRRLSAVDVCTVPDPSNAYNDRSTMIKVMEYMALERPIVAFDLPETRVSAGDAALYVKPNDHRAFAQALALLAADPERRRAMGREGRRRVEQAFAWSYSVPPLLKVYEDLLGGPADAMVPDSREISAAGRA
jgi:glycosyltransferase involved in cell wall biosynthesis